MFVLLGRWFLAAVFWLFGAVLWLDASRRHEAPGLGAVLLMGGSVAYAVWSIRWYFADVARFWRGPRRD